MTSKLPRELRPSKSRRSTWGSLSHGRLTRATFLVSLVCTTAVFGCTEAGNPDSSTTASGSPKSATTSSLPEASEPSAGYELWTSERYTVEILDDWVPVADFPIELEGETYYSDLFQGPFVENFTVNINIGGAPTGELTTDQTYAVEVGRARDMHDDLVIEDISLAGQPAKLLHYVAGELSNQDTFDQSQVLFVANDTEWVLTLSTALGLRDEYMAVFQHVWESFQAP